MRPTRAWLEFPGISVALVGCGLALQGCGGGVVSVGGGAAGGPADAAIDGATGGTSTGGTRSGGTTGTGGTNGADGTNGTGGTNGAGGTNGTGGATGTGGTTPTTPGDTVTWTAGDYASRKWARWPIPNPPAMNLPHPMSYTVVAGSVLDNVTGLTWQTSTNTATTSWQEALTTCQSLGTGWSLPTRIELTSILDNARSGGKVNPPFTFGNGAGWTWASTPWVVNQRRNLTGAAALSWFSNFAVGDSNNSLSQTSGRAYARCVRIPTTQILPATHYTVAGNGEVKDNYTGLTWQQGHASATATLTWNQADAYCKALALNAQSWRLPSLNELASIVDDVPTGDVSPAIDRTAFPVTSPDLQYWSASPYGTSTAERWTLNFEDGFTAHRPLATLGSARCVR